ncbi:putative C6 finger domain protein [Glonium stellatum]|uniref:Putative C6 finger domain protein n=1 Tax=Glonium stellatum TaxID=574774 RepID=A0A8E2FB09_9PEZI|nr:putative C6 finger domain protein [Glonium stellatum]
MVGVPRSGGCSFCIKRRVKCDEARPACSKCQKYGIECPGYEKVLKFVAGKNHRSRPQNRHARPPQILALLEKERRITIPTTISSPNLYPAQYLSFLIEDISWSNSAISDVLFMRRWLSCITTLLGTNHALDKAIRCFTTHYFGKLSRNEQMVRYSRTAYGEALSGLQKTLNSFSDVTSSETLSAATLLCLYEFFAPTRRDARMKHADGIGRLIRLRGPQRHKSEFDNIMLVLVRGILVMEALFSGKDCFLEAEEWRSINTDTTNQHTPSQLFLMVDEFSKYQTMFPRLVKEAYATREAYAAGLANPMEVMSLVNRTLDLHYRLLTWFEQFTASVDLPKEVPSSLNDPLYPIVYRYSDPTLATIFCGYYATVIILQEILRFCQYDVDYTRETSTLMDNICKSIEYIDGTGIWGPYRAGFALRIAYEVGPPETKLWVKNWLGRFNKIFGATDPQHYPA